MTTDAHAPASTEPPAESAGTVTPADVATDTRLASIRPARPGLAHPSSPETVADPVAGYHVTIVPHTHWDREWYLPFELFRMRLVRTVERICEVLETEPRFRAFTLDGQAVILEDAVDVRPDLEPRIRRLLADGRLVTGPSYVLPDEFLSSPEGLVRNLLLGRA